MDVNFKSEIPWLGRLVHFPSFEGVLVEVSLFYYTHPHGNLRCRFV